MSINNNPFKDNIHADTYRDFFSLVSIINDLAEEIDRLRNVKDTSKKNSGFAMRVRAKHHLSNILEKVQPIR